MSWSVNVVGKPQAVKKELEAVLAGMGPGQSREEYAAALPCLLGILQLNEPVMASELYAAIEVIASGTSGVSNGEVTYRQCTVSVRRLPSRLVE